MPWIPGQDGSCPTGSPTRQQVQGEWLCQSLRGSRLSWLDSHRRGGGPPRRPAQSRHHAALRTCGQGSLCIPDSIPAKAQNFFHKCWKILELGEVRCIYMCLAEGPSMDLSKLAHSWPVTQGHWATMGNAGIRPYLHIPCHYQSSQFMLRKQHCCGLHFLLFLEG